MRTISICAAAVVGLMVMLSPLLFRSKCPPGQCPGHFTRFGVGYCDRESCLKHNPQTTYTVDLFGCEKK